jgi:hypothetical protein
MSAPLFYNFSTALLRHAHAHRCENSSRSGGKAPVRVVQENRIVQNSARSTGGEAARAIVHWVKD